MKTLLTQAPLPRGTNSRLLQKFGYPVPPYGKKVLHVTFKKPPLWTNIKGKRALKIDVNDKIEIISAEGEALGFWTEETLREKFERKYPGLMYVKADCRGREANEEFWFNEALLLKGFNFEGVKELIRRGIILIDTRIGRHPDGRTHDHGTGFRIFEDKFDLCFKERKRII